MCNYLLPIKILEAITSFLRIPRDDFRGSIKRKWKPYYSPRRNLSRGALRVFTVVHHSVMSQEVPLDVIFIRLKIGLDRQTTAKQ